MRSGGKKSARDGVAKPRLPVVINVNSEEAVMLRENIAKKAKLFYDNSVVLSKLNSK